MKMNDEIIDEQDGYCIWQTQATLADGRRHAIVHPKDAGVMTHGVFLRHDDNTFEWVTIHKSFEDASRTAEGYTGELTCFVVPLESGKFP